IQFLQNEGADEGGIAFWLQGGSENAIAPLKFEVNSVNAVPCGYAAVGVKDVDLSADRESQLLRHGRWQHQTRRAGVYDAEDTHPAHLIGRQIAAPNGSE